jgi:hypothetical protein
MAACWQEVLMSFSIRCPYCRGKFPWNPVQGMPEFCALCGEHVGHDDDSDDVTMPFIRSNGKSASIDKVYRDMEKGSEVRARAAAELAGTSVADMSDLKITNMRDNQRQGDYAVPEVSNAITQFMQAHPEAGGFRSSEALAYSGSVATGPEPNAGAKMRTTLHNYHGQATGGTAVSDRPANETMQQGYRRRG